MILIDATKEHTTNATKKSQEILGVLRMCTWLPVLAIILPQRGNDDRKIAAKEVHDEQEEGDTSWSDLEQSLRCHH